MIKGFCFYEQNNLPKVPTLTSKHLTPTRREYSTQIHGGLRKENV